MLTIMKFLRFYTLFGFWVVVGLYNLGRDRTSGIDGVSWKEYGKHLDENLKDLVIRMKVKRYKPQPVKRVYIPKNEHEKRPLGLPALEDNGKRYQPCRLF